MKRPLRTASWTPRFVYIMTVLTVCVIMPPLVFAVIGNGSNAVNMIGQFDDDLSDPEPQYEKQPVNYSRGNDGPNKLGLYYPHGVFVDENNNRLFVSDSDNHRILVYDLDGSNDITNRIPDYVIGQSNFATGRNNSGDDRFDRPYAITSDGANYLFVADQNNNRVLVFDLINIANGMSASYVLGQTNFSNTSADLSVSRMDGPTGVAYDNSNNRLYVADTGNNRVLVFDASSLSDGMDAANVLGQTDFDSDGTGLSDWQFEEPFGVAFDQTDKRLFVADSGNNRVLVFDAFSINDGEAADNVIGQEDFSSDSGTTDIDGLFYPRGVAFDDGGDRLFVASGSHRVTVYQVDSITNGEDATGVLGQSNFTNSNQVTTQAGLRGTSQIAYDEGNDYLYVVDQFNHRVLQFNVASVSNGENATDVIGQYDSSLTAPAANYTKGYPDNGPSKLGFWGTQGGSVIDTTSKKLFVSDTFNNRILVFNLNASNQLIERIPDNVIGQTDFVSSGVTVTSTGLNKPRGMVLDQTNQRLFVADSLNNRVLMYDVSSVSDGMAATRVLGQSDFTSSGVNVTQSGLGRPIGLAYRSSDQTLFVGDRLNHRVVTYDVNTVTNGENAENVLGQTDFTTATTGTTQNKFNLPYGLAYDSNDDILWVSELTNNRIMSFDVSSITDGENAQNVLGQANFTSNTPRTTTGGLRDPAGMSFDTAGQRLFVGDSSNNRILVFDVEAVTDNENAVNVLGQGTFVASGAAVVQNAIFQPFGVFYDPNNKLVYANENANYRITIFDTEEAAASSSSSSSTSSSGGGSSGTSGGSGGSGGSTGGGTQAGGSRFRNGTPAFTSERTYMTKLTACIADLSSVAEPKMDKNGFVETEINNLNVRFSDVKASEWYGKFVSFVLSQSLASGYNDAQGKPLGLFRPERQVTYVEFAKMLLRAIGEQPSSKTPKNKSALASWGKGEIARVEELGWTVFTPTVDVNAPISRGAMLQTIVEALQLPLTNVTPVYGDLKDDHPHAKAIATAMELCIISGDTAADGSLLPRVRPDDTLNRAELSKILATLWALGLRK